MDSILPSDAGELYVPAVIEVKEKAEDSGDQLSHLPEEARGTQAEAGAAAGGLDSYVGAPEGAAQTAAGFVPIIQDDKAIETGFSPWVSDPDIVAGGQVHSVVLQEEIDARRRAEEEAEGPEDILEAARAEGERLKEEARKQGFEQGYQKGQGKALEEALEGLRPTLEGFAEKTQELSDYRAEVLRMAEREVFELAVLMGKKVLGAEIRLHPDAVQTVVRSALERAIGWGKATIRVHPEDHALLEQVRGRIEENIAGVMISKIEPDPTVGRGGCILESNFGEVDARLERQSEEVESELRRFFEENQDLTSSDPPQEEVQAASEESQDAPPKAESPPEAEPPPEVEPFQPRELGGGGEEVPPE